MLLNKLIIAPRLRQHWSALDLGVAVVKKFWLSCALLWLLLAAPIYTMLILLCGEEYFWLPLVLVWWLKPLFERPIVLLLSRQLFDRPCGPVTVLREIKQWLLPGLLYSLASRRFSPARSFFMPVILLERLGGKAYTRRTQVLGSKGGSQAFWLTVTLVHIEQFLTLALFAMTGFLFPFFGLGFDTFVEPSHMDRMAANTVYFFAMAVVAPFYVGCGFILYICRRMELEAWDIEICFRDMAAKKPGRAGEGLARR